MSIRAGIERFRRLFESHENSENDINILLLGPTGVGKTTLINAFSNYLVYNKLNDAIAGELQVVIPAWFTFMDENFEEKTIVIGSPDDQERKGAVGESCTRTCRSFVYNINGRKLRLIDTPGVGDTQGPLQDEKNFENILAYLNQYEHLNGICILLKPDEERLTGPLRFCVKELLRHLHVNAKDNLIFTFTNARKTFFKPGPSAPAVRQLLKNLRDQYNVVVPFDTNNTFLLDNEAFRFLALCKNGVEINSSEKQAYSDSWDHTITEFNRLISKVLKCEKHNVAEIVSLNQVQQIIRKLSRPIAETARLIEENIKYADELVKNNSKAVLLP